MKTMFVLILISLVMATSRSLFAQEWDIVGLHKHQFFSIASDGSREPQLLDRQPPKVPIKLYGKPVDVIEGPFPSPDGNWDAYVTMTWVMAAKNSLIVLVDKRNGVSTFVREGAYWDEHPRWLPNSQSLVFLGGNAGIGAHRLMTCPVGREKLRPVVLGGNSEAGNVTPIVTRDGKILFVRKRPRPASESSEWMSEVVEIADGADRTLFRTSFIFDWGIDANDSCLAIATKDKLCLYSWPEFQLMESWEPSEVDERWQGASIKSLTWRNDDKALVVTLNGTGSEVEDEIDSHWLVLDWDHDAKRLSGRKLPVPPHSRVLGFQLSVGESGKSRR